MAVGAQKGRINLDTIELLFLLAALAIVPQGLDLSARLDETSAPRLEHWAAFAQPGAALLAMASFFLPPDHESKWAAEEIVRNAGLDYTVVKAGVIYGRGDHMLDHLSHALHTFPVFALVGLRDKPIRPLAVEDLVRILEAALLCDRLSRQTVAITGPEEMLFREAVRRVAHAVGKWPLFLPMPLFFDRLLAWCAEAVMAIPMVSLAQFRILSEGIVTPLPVCSGVPEDLRPQEFFTEEQIRKGLPPAGAFGLRDLRWFA